MSRRLTAALLGLLGLVSLGCSLSRHRLPPVSYPAERLRQLEAEAVRRCEALRGAEGTPRRPFTSDGCSLWPDRAWRHCCVAHDMRYWCGGPASERRAADAELRRCVAATGAAATARLMQCGTRLGGARWMPFWWRWGYGHAWPARRP